MGRYRVVAALIIEAPCEEAAAYGAGRVISHPWMFSISDEWRRDHPDLPLGDGSLLLDEAEFLECRELTDASN